MSMSVHFTIRLNCVWKIWCVKKISEHVVWGHECIRELHSCRLYSLQDCTLVPKVTKTQRQVLLLNCTYPAIKSTSIVSTPKCKGILIDLEHKRIWWAVHRYRLHGVCITLWLLMHVRITINSLCIIYLGKRAGILSYSCYKQIFDTDPAKWYAQSEKYALHKLLPSHAIKQFLNTHSTHKSWIIYGTYISRLIHGILMFLIINSWLIQDIQNSFLLFTVSRIPCSFVVCTNWGTVSGTSKECILTCCCIPFVAQFIPGWNVAMTLGGWSSQLEEVEAEEIIHPVRVPPIRLCCTLYTRGVLCDSRLTVHLLI